MTVYTFTKDTTPPMPGSELDRPRRLSENAAEFATALTSGQAWESFCEGLRSAGQSILRSEEAASDTDLAEGFQYLLGLVHSLVERELYRTDASKPAFLRVQTDVVKVAMDNPDASLMSAPLSDDGVFLIYGALGSARRLEFVITGSGRPVMHYLDEFEVGDGGDFSVTLSREEAGQLDRAAAGRRFHPRTKNDLRLGVRRSAPSGYRATGHRSHDDSTVLEDSQPG